MTPKRLSALLLLSILLAAGCAPRPTVRSVRLDTLREQETYTLHHTVAPGETLRSIAELYYGDPDRAGEIALGNGLDDPDRLAVGRDLQLAFSESEWADADRRYRARGPYNRGVAALEDGRLEVAGTAFGDALALDPGFDDARFNLAQVQLRRGRNEAAEALLNDLRKRRPEDPEVLASLGNALFFQTRFGEAVAVFRELRELDPTHRAGAFGLARALTEAGLTESAITAWEAYLRLDGTSTWADRAREQLARLRG